MERTAILGAMSELKLYGMKAAYDEIIATAVKRQHEPQRIVGDLLTAEISEKQARSIKYQITIAKLPLAKDIDDFVFDDVAGQRGAWCAISPAAHFLAASAQCRAGRRHGNRQKPSRHRNRPSLHPRWQTRALLQCRRSRQQTRGRGARRPPGPHGRLSLPHGLHPARRTRLFALCPVRRPVAVPPDQPALRAELGHRHHQSRLRRMAAASSAMPK